MLTPLFLTKTFGNSYSIQKFLPKSLYNFISYLPIIVKILEGKRKKEEKGTGCFFS
jgi:hypothetical protein